MRGGEQGSEEVALLRMAARTAKVAGWALHLPEQHLVWSDELNRIMDRPLGRSPSLEEALRSAPDEHRDRLAAMLQRCSTEGAPYVHEFPLTTATGRAIWLRVMGEAVRHRSGAIIRVQGAAMDITEHKALEREREQLEARLAHTLEAITDAFYTLDPNWRFTYLNRRAEQLLQRSRHELLGAVAWEAFPEVRGSSVAAAFQRAVDEQAPVVVSDFYEPLGIWLEAQVFPSEDGGLAVYFRDISAQVEAREVLLERQALMDKAQDAIWAIDLDHRVTYWNDGAEQLWGWPADDVVGQPLRDLLVRDPAEFDRALAEVTRSGSWSGEMTHIDAAGSERLVQGRWSLVRRDDGAPQSILGISTDITDQRHAEQQALRAQRLEAIGTLAGGIAHDLNNVLTPILMSVELLAMDETDPRRLEMLEMVRANTKRGAQMVRQVLSFAGRIEGQRVPIEVGELLQDVRHIIRDTFPKNVHFTTGRVPDGVRVMGDPTQLHQVLLNLSLNARDAMPDGGTIQVDAAPWLVDERAAARPGIGPGRYVALRVSDDGHGMDPDVLTRIFDPFFTTKQPGEGTGLGLATSMAIVTSHHGTMQVRSEPGVGTTFEILLPAVGAAAVPADAGVDALPHGAGETVLIIDDEAQVRTSTRRSLERFGYKVLTAADGADAITIVAEDPAVDVVLTDMMMPVLDGPATIRVLRTMRPDLPIIAASGLDASDAVGRAIDAGVTQFLAKPYTSSALLTALQQVLAGAADDGA